MARARRSRPLWSNGQRGTRLYSLGRFRLAVARLRRMCCLSASSFRIGQLITASRGGSRKKLLPDSTDADGVPQPGNYVKWLCSPAFAHKMTFPHHLRLYLALKEIEGAAWVSLAGETEPWNVEVCADARTLFDKYAASVMTPRDGETDPYVDGA